MECGRLGSNPGEGRSVKENEKQNDAFTMGTLVI